jgi:hypothetical protein
MRKIGLPEQYDDNLNCMLLNATAPRIVNKLSFKLKENFPFTRLLVTTIETYLCRIHTTLSEVTGNGLPLDTYLKDLKDKYRDRTRALPLHFCKKIQHVNANPEC